MEQNQNQQSGQFKCPGNCLQCLPAQRQYCASQHAYAAVFDPNGEGELFPKEFAVSEPATDAPAEAAK